MPNTDRVLLTARPPLAAFVVPALVMLAGFVVRNDASSRMQPQLLGALAIAAGGAWLTYNVFVALTNRLTISSTRVTARHGLVGEVTLDLALTAVESISSRSSLPGVLLRYGTISLRGSGGSVTPVQLVGSPRRFCERALEIVANARRIPAADVTPPSVAPGRNDVHQSLLAACAIGGEALAFDEGTTAPVAVAALNVVQAWDASHSVPRRGDGKRVNDPLLVAWRPDGRQLGTACDAFGMTRWAADGQRIGGGTPAYAYGHPTRFFWSPDGSHVLLTAETALNQWWSVQDSSGAIVHQVIERGKTWGYDEFHKLDRTRWFNPWRPGTTHFLVAAFGEPTLELFDIADLPRPSPHEPPRWLPAIISQLATVALHRLKKAKGERSDLDTLDQIEPVRSLNLAWLGAQDRDVLRYAWHPGGQYIAVTTGDRQQHSSRRVHILHFDTGERVASLPATITAIGWSPGGRLLLCQRWSDLNRVKWTIEQVVWDALTSDVRRLTESEEREPWVRRFAVSWPHFVFEVANADTTLLASQGKTDPYGPAGQTRTTLTVEPIARLGQGAGAQIDDVAFASWSPTDPLVLAVVGGKDGRQLQIVRVQLAGQ